MVSNCVTNSKREVLVAKLQNFVQVDVYGNCGPFNCTKSGDYDPGKLHHFIQTFVIAV